MNERNISVIIPIYNSEKTIIPVIEGIINQTAHYLIKEIIIVNDGSTDKSKKMVDNFINQYIGEIKIHQEIQRNVGVSAARNKGMDISQSEWVAFCDSDDLWLPFKIEYQYKIIQANTELDFLGGYVFKKPFKIFNKEIEGLITPNLKQILIKFFPWPSTVIMKKKIFEELGGFELGRNHGEDIQYFLLIHERYNFFFDSNQVVEIGFGKESFGESGLSGDLKAMYSGNINIINELRRRKRITHLEYMCFWFLYYLKHIRRVFITKKRKSEFK